MASFSAPGVLEAFQQLSEAGKEAIQAAQVGQKQAMEMMSLGFPAATGGGSYAPFDAIGDFIRGTRGIMLDMFRCPDKIIAAMERLVPMIHRIGRNATKSLSPFVFIPLHKGIESFMSLAQ